MNLFKLAEKMGKKMKWYDFSLLKLSVFSCAFFLVTVWEPINNFVHRVGWMVWLAIFVVVTIPLLRKMFK